MELAIEQLLDWAQSKGVFLNGVQPKTLKGRGIGVVATRRLESNEVILRVPVTLVKSVDNTPREIVNRLRGASGHAILAASLCLDDSADLATWRTVFPSAAEMKVSMPICWPPEMQAFLPQGAKVLLTAQEQKFFKDWKRVSASYHHISQEDYLYHWLLVNTRSFYQDSKNNKLPEEHHMVLQPVADLFNHTPHGFCAHSWDRNFFTLKTSRVHHPGEEVYIQYGPHGNDVLLTEYGFTLPLSISGWDETRLDAYICPLFARHERETLEDRGFWGNYVLDTKTVCYRTEIALHLLALPHSRWCDMIDCVNDEPVPMEHVNVRLLEIFFAYSKDIDHALEKLGGATAGDELIRGILLDRWLQVKQIVLAATERLSNVAHGMN